MFRPSLPAPRQLLALFVLGTGETQLLQVLFERVIGLGISEYLQVNDDVHVLRAGMCGSPKRPCADDVSGRKASDEKDRIPPRSEPSQEGHEHTLAIERVRFAVSVAGLGL